MIISAKLICLVIAVVLFGLAAFFNWFVDDTSRISRFNLVAAGLFFFSLRELFP